MSLVASRYSEALFSLGLDTNRVESFKDDLKYIKSIFDDVDNLNDFFLSERIQKKDKKEVLKNVLANKVDKDVLNFIFLLTDKGRLSHYNEIVNEYISLANNELNIKEGIIESARPLDQNLIEELENVLSKDKIRIELKPKINKSLISGFKIKFEHEVIDASMKDKIDKMQEMLSRKGGESWN